MRSLHIILKLTRHLGVSIPVQHGTQLAKPDMHPCRYLVWDGILTRSQFAPYGFRPRPTARLFRVSKRETEDTAPLSMAEG